MIKKLLTGYLIIVAIAAGVLSCKKDNGPGNSPSPAKPFETEKGTALGNAVTKMIGPSGGTLTSGDGKITITVQAGTVTANTNFSIQPITLTIPSAEGDTAYRLLPEGTTFAKPVTITYRYNDADISGTTADLLFGCYQSADGKWLPVPSALNKTNKTIALTSKHFSDWAIVAALELKVKKPTLTAMEETDIELVGIIPSKDDNIPLAPLPPGDIPTGFVEHIGDWDVIDGGGIVGVANATPTLATYSPFSPITHGAKAHVSLDIRGNMRIQDTLAPGGLRKIGQVILIAEITLVNDAYMIGSFDGLDISASNTEALEANGHIFINASTSSGDTSVMSYLLHVVADKAGSYPCGDLTQAGTAQATIGGEINLKPIAYVTEYIHCGPPAHIEYSGASVTIDNWGPVGTYITGSFNGPVYPQGAQNCSPTSRGFSIQFRALRTI